MEVTHDGLYSCQDCLMYLANGDLSDCPDDVAESLPGKIEERWPAGHLVTTSTEETDLEFSWRACDCCGSQLGGSRHPFVVMR